MPLRSSNLAFRRRNEFLNANGALKVDITKRLVKFASRWLSYINESKYLCPCRLSACCWGSRRPSFFAELGSVQRGQRQEQQGGEEREGGFHGLVYFCLASVFVAAGGGTGLGICFCQAKKAALSSLIFSGDSVERSFRSAGSRHRSNSSHARESFVQSKDWSSLMAFQSPLRMAVFSARFDCGSRSRGRFSAGRRFWGRYLLGRLSIASSL